MFGPPQKKFLKAAAEGDMEALRHCWNYDIPEDYSINAPGAKGVTALHNAAENGRVDAVRYLLEKKANIEAKTEDGATPLFTAVANGQSEAAKALLAAGADANTHANSYTYPLHWAAHNGDIDLVKLLVSKGADVNVVTKDGERTPMYYAIASNRGTVAEFLLASGARTNIPGTDGQTDADYARANNSRIAAMIDAAAPKTEPAPVLPAVAEAAPAQAPAVTESETWKLMGADKAAFIGVYPDLNRKITEIFNFATRERRTITENLTTGAETIGSAEKFDALSDDAVAKATEIWKQLASDTGGTAAKRSFNL